MMASIFIALFLALFVNSVVPMLEIPKCHNVALVDHRLTALLMLAMEHITSATKTAAFQMKWGTVCTRSPTWPELSPWRIQGIQIQEVVNSSSMWEVRWKRDEPSIELCQTVNSKVD